MPAPVSSPSSAAPRFLPLLLLLFVGSGCAALIYEVVWFQLLQLVIGSSAVSLAVLLGTFMGGMCLGSLALPRLVSATRHPLRVYALLELGIGAAGLLVLSAMPAVGRLYSDLIGHGTPGILLRALIAAACLLPPTMMMGATLPAVARWIEITPRGVSWLGFFYGGNTLGAVGGCLLAGFYLLRTHDVAVATWCAAAVNAAVGGIALFLSHHTPGSPVTPAAPPTQVAVTGSNTVMLIIALSGFCALGAEVVWTRNLALMLGATVYTFSIILAVFLVGLTLGSTAGSAVTRRAARPRFVLATCQLLQVAAIAWAAYAMVRILPYWPGAVPASAGLAIKFQMDLARCALAILPAAVLWGASFPLALASVAATGQDAGRLVGRTYAANTVGAIAGAIAAGMLLIPALGTQHTQQLLIIVSFAAATLALAPRRRAHLPIDGGIWSSAVARAFRLVEPTAGEPTARRASRPWVWARSSLRAVGTTEPEADMGKMPMPLAPPSTGRCAPRRLLSLSALAGTALLAVGACRFVPILPWQLVAYGRQMATTDYGAKLLFLGEGMNASVAVSEQPGGARFFHVSGKTEASNLQKDMRLQRMLGHIPALLHPHPRSVLIVGCGAGVTAGSFVLHPSVERIVICDIEPLIPRVVATYFRSENYDVLRDRRVEVIHDDARHFVATTTETFDIITSDPIHPWVKGSAVLYSKEYFELCRRRLNPGGLLTQWVPFYEANRAVVQSEIATFFSAFPEGTIWGNDDDGWGYDTVLLGQVAPLKIDINALQQRLDRADHTAVQESLAGLALGSALDLLSTYAGRDADLKTWLAPAEINRDLNLRLQYLAGLQLDSSKGADAYIEMLSYRRFPQDIFQAPAAQLEALKTMLAETLLNSL